MNFDLDKSIEILEKTPKILKNLLENLSDEWIYADEGEGTWSAFDVIGHLIHGEMTDWLPRLDLILSEKEDKTFEPFDRFAQFELSRGKTLSNLLKEFKKLRKKNLKRLSSKNLTYSDFQKTGYHPALGEVTVAQLLSTWTVHDLNHIAQIARVMAKQYKTEVGPWVQYLGILN
ncbi:MAG: DinB family protein [Saprospiraceae bacterium]|nr:DinB family protein [Saprospiraceae bacterium]